MAWLRLQPLTSAFLHFGLITFVLFLNGLRAEAGGSGDVPSTGQNNESCTGSSDCKEGVILPIWYPENPSLGDKIARVIVYFVALIYMFLGVSIIADRFMASIEVITSQEREVTIKKPNGETSTTTIRVWNETVSNLTLMALGSSAPEILLSLIEVCGHGFIAGDLGPSTIVGSAAFNMFIIIGICVYVIPDGETRKIKHLRVFFVTAAWSIFAYIWLYMILAVFSPGVVQVWEGLLTLFFFPVCVLLAWVADKRLLFYKYMHKKYRTDKHRGIIIETEGDHPKGIEMDGKMMNSHFLDGHLVPLEGKEVDESRREMIRILKDLKQKHPEKDLDQLVEMANYYALSHQQKSRAFYRIQATRMMTGAGNILKKHAAEQAKKTSSMSEVHANEPEDFVSKVFFDPCSYQCLENCGAVLLTVVRKGGDTSKTLYVDYKTEDGSANAGADYEFTEGTVVLKPGETQKEFSVGIIDDDIFEEDEHFFVRLSNVRMEEEQPEEGMSPRVRSSLPLPRAVLVSPCVATVTILDDDHAGIFTFECDTIHVSESIGVMEVKVLRTSGARGTVIVPFRTVEGTAKGGGEDFEDIYGELEFKNDETVKAVHIKVIDGEAYEKNKNYFLEMMVPRMVDMSCQKALLLSPEVTDRKLTVEEEEAKRIAEMGKPILGEHPKLEVIIEESYEFKQGTRMRMSQARRGCLPALTTSCTSSRSSGRCCLPACPRQSTATAGPASLSPFSSSACSPPSLGTWPPTSAAPLASRTRSRLLFLWHSAPQCQIRLPAKRLPSRTCTQTPPSATSRAATPSMSSWALAWPGPWPPSTGPCRDRSSTCRLARWPSPSPSSPSSRSCASACSCTAGGPTWAGSWAALVAASWPRLGSL
ncbi:sodium/calcium exchanger 3 isoform X7 [Budorcas taxicolor]|uniref:sodium/calcium exchanger 3 isoform X7 n=1 Tax=Budorcas taxicolor TaxID=37181 RepID=UPI002284933F|nr:sodium/calcium exchanger 3 isoform X7 [Budorcas taxicolor]